MKTILQLFILKHFLHDPQFWMEKIHKSTIITKLFNGIMNILCNLNLGVKLYTFTKTGKVIQVSSILEPEPQVKEAFTPSSNDVVVDVGAYVGNFTLKTKGKLGKNGLIIAVEPQREAYNLLLRNLKTNGIENARTFNMALSDYDGECNLSSRGAPGLHSIVKQGEKTITVPCRKLDSLLKEIGVSHVDWVKVDVEGAEYRVLQGMKETLTNNVGVKCIFEIHGNYPESHFVEPTLREMGFVVSRIDHIHILAQRN